MFEFVFEAAVDFKVRIDTDCGKKALEIFNDLRVSGELFKKAEIIDGDVIFIVEKRKIQCGKTY